MNGSDFFGKLHTFFVTSTPEKFEEVFGKVIGQHLFEKWTGYARYDLVAFIGTLDNPNREALYQFLTKGL